MLHPDFGDDKADIQIGATTQPKPVIPGVKHEMTV